MGFEEVVSDGIPPWGSLQLGYTGLLGIFSLLFTLPSASILELFFERPPPGKIGVYAVIPVLSAAAILGITRTFRANLGSNVLAVFPILYGLTAAAAWLAFHAILDHRPTRQARAGGGIGPIPPPGR
jgi:hypothetical protein